MAQVKHRKSALWVLLDFFATLTLLSGILKFMHFEVPYLSDLSRPFPESLLIALGLGITILSMLLFLLLILKTNASSGDKDVSVAVERTKR